MPLSSKSGEDSICSVDHDGAALATVVGVLVEVPVMLLVVRLVNSTRGWYERGPRQANT